jgi:hypothetical protein
LTAIGGPHADGNPLSTFLLRARRLQNIEPVDLDPRRGQLLARSPAGACVRMARMSSKLDLALADQQIAPGLHQR